jgi:hypothetical protein
MPNGVCCGLCLTSGVTRIAPVSVEMLTDDEKRRLALDCHASRDIILRRQLDLGVEDHEGLKDGR